ncbi:MAG: O-linked N-acetylglucosamine transferase, SPINDLY family protein [Acidiferrobacterales bacterium]
MPGQILQGVSAQRAAGIGEAERACALGTAMAARGRTQEAVAHYERALALRPDYAEACNGLGNVLWALGRMAPAAACYERSIAMRPDYAPAHNNLGLALVALGGTDNAERAAACYGRALALRPDFAEAHFNLGNVFRSRGGMDRAVSCYERALELKPDYWQAHCNLGEALCALGRMAQATAHCEQGVALQPDDALTHNNLGNALTGQGRIEQALVHYERALVLRPDFGAAHSNLLLALNYASGRDPAAVRDAHLDYAKRRENPPAPSRSASSVDRPGNRRLRIGYLSSDFRRHSVAHFIEPVLAHHDHDRFEIFCYFNHPQADELTKRLQTHANHWRDIYPLSDDLVARQIQADQIDILIDLNGHTALNRLPVFTRKPAPIQVTWLGYPNTTGLSAMDYRLTDGFADPAGMTDHLHSEQLVRLPETFSCYQPPRDAPAVSALPARAGGCVNFGSFNNLAKINPQVVAVWAKILLSVPGSRLTLKSVNLGEDSVQQSIRDAFGHRGIAPSRLDLLGPDVSAKAHLGRYGGIDIGLDPFPYNGATTTCEALWMGVPVVTLAGATHAGRVGVSQLSNLDLTELIAGTPEEYVETAVRLAGDPERLASLRAQLRPRLAASPLTDAQRFTAGLERALVALGRR